MSMSAHQALTTIDCVQPGCPSEAAKGSEFCEAHRPSRLEAERRARLERMFGAGSRVGAQVAPAEPGRERPTMPIPAAIAVLTGAPAPDVPPRADEPKAAPPTQETPMALATCKIDGCDNPRLDARGVYGGLCAGHKNQKRSARSAAAVKPPPAAPAPEPAPAPREAVVPDQTPATPTSIERVAELEAAVAGLEEKLAVAKQELHAAATAYVSELRDRYGIAA